MIHARSLASAALLAAACLSGCAADEAEDAPPALEVEPIELGFSEQTTDGDVARGNLDAQIRSLEGLAERHGSDGYRSALVPKLLQRAQLAGDIADVDLALAHASGISDASTRARIEAAVLSARHEWSEALARLPEGDPARETIAIARGERLDEIVESRRARAMAESSFRTETDLAIALGEAGRFEEADAAYLRALAAYRDVSPFAVAFVQFQRGVLWAERAGRPGRAVALYREAVRRVPDYVVANVHLAELEVRLGEREAAVARLERIAAWSADPEPASLLARILEGERAATYLERARARYEALLATHPLAYADHATEFFLGPGSDPARALSLALSNLENRRTERAYDLAIRAALAAGDPSLACRLASEVGTPRIAPLAATLSELPRCD